MRDVDGRQPTHFAVVSSFAGRSPYSFNIYFLKFTFIYFSAMAKLISFCFLLLFFRALFFSNLAIDPECSSTSVCAMHGHGGNKFGR